MTHEFRWYVDLPERDLGLCSPGDTVYIDIEEGCFTKADDVRNEGTRLTNHRLKTGIYCTRDSVTQAFGASKELAEWPCPLWIASWYVEPYKNFEPLLGWTEPEMWQVSEKGIAGINVDLNFDPLGRLWADFGNYTRLEPFQAWLLGQMCHGFIIGLQDEGIARYNLDMLRSLDSH